jgi:LysM repeat protein
VRPGDTLWSLSRRYGIPVRVIVEMNRPLSARRLKVGRRLIIPRPARVSRFARLPASGIERGLGQQGSKAQKAGVIFHRVRRGETLWSISKKYGVRVSDLSKWNKLQGHKILPGDTLKVIITSS